MSDLAEQSPGSARAAERRAGDRPVGAPPATLRAGLRRSMALRLTLLVGLTLALLLAGLLAGSWFYWRQVLRAQADAQLSAVAASRRDMVEAQVQMLLQRVLVNTDRGELRGLLHEIASGLPETQNRTWAQNTLNYMADGLPIRAASLADMRGRIVQSSDPNELGHEILDTSEFQAGLHEAHLGWPRAVGERFEATLAAPVRTRVEPRQTYGVLVARVDVSALAAALRDTTGLGRTGEAILGVRTAEGLRFLFPPRHAPNPASVIFGTATDRRVSFRKMQDYRGVPVLAALQPIAYRQWLLVVKMDEAEAYEPVRHALRLGGLAGLALIGVGLLAAYALARSFIRPVRQLAEAAARIAAGENAPQIPVQSADELGALSASFNVMTAAIRTRGAERDAAEKALREADRRKDEFLAMLGHELRNPLSAIAHAVQLWPDAENEPADPADLALTRGVIARQTGNLNRLVDDLLDVARITEGKIELRRRPVELSAAIRQALEAVRPLVEARRHSVELSLDGEKLWVDADPTRLEQIVINLLTNAIKYTPDGGHIAITERLEEGTAVLTVRDDGQGIAPEMLPRIFELFTQADHTLDRATGGLGIGLNLCRQLVELHGGTIHAESLGLGQGAVFTVRLPALSAAEVPRAALADPAGAETACVRRILLVDDNQDTVRALSRLLARRGHEVATAFDGLAALEVARQFQPEILLLDLGLPGLDGYELGRRLRAAGFPHAPIIAISGYAQESDRARSRAAGFNHHFAKPVDFETLAAIINAEPVAAN